MKEGKGRFSTAIHGLLASSAIIQGFGLLATMAVGILLARYLGPKNYGVYGLVMAVVSLATVVAQFGLPQFATREAARSMSTRPQASPTAVIRRIAELGLAFWIGVPSLIAVIMLLSTPQWTEGRTGIILYAAATIFLLSIFGIGIGLTRGFGHNLFGQLLEMLARPVATAIALFAVYRLAGGLTVASTLAVQAAVLFAAAVALGLLLVRQRGPAASPPPDYDTRGWVRTCLAFTLSNLLAAFNALYPILVAGLFVSAEELGIFRVALSAAVLIALPSSIANIAVGPLVARLYHDRQDDQLAGVVSQTTIVAFASTSFVFVLLLLAGRTLLSFLFGAEYVGAYVPLLLLGAAQLIISAFGILGTFLSLTGRERLVLRANMISVPLGLSSTFPLTAAFGISGAAIGNLVMALAWFWFVFNQNQSKIDAPLSLLAATRYVVSGRAETGVQP